MKCWICGKPTMFNGTLTGGAKPNHPQCSAALYKKFPGKAWAKRAIMAHESAYAEL